MRFLCVWYRLHITRISLIFSNNKCLALVPIFTRRNTIKNIWTAPKANVYQLQVSFSLVSLRSYAIFCACRRLVFFVSNLLLIKIISSLFTRNSLFPTDLPPGRQDISPLRQNWNQVAICKHRNVCCGPWCEFLFYEGNIHRRANKFKQGIMLQIRVFT